MVGYPGELKAGGGAGNLVVLLTLRLVGFFETEGRIEV